MNKKRYIKSFLILSIPVFNDYSAKKVEKDLRKLPLPEKTECIDSVSKTGILICGDIKI